MLKAKEEARKQKERRQENWLRAVGGIAAVLFLLGIWITTLWNSAKQNEDAAKQASAALLTLIKANGKAAVGVVESVEAALRELEQQAAKLTSAIEAAATKSPPEKPELAEFQRRATAAEGSFVALDEFAQSIRQAAQTSKDRTLSELAATLEKRASESRERQSDLEKSPAVAPAVTKALTERLAQAEYFLNGLIGWKTLDEAMVKSRANDISAAIAHLNAIDAISAAALVLGFDRSTNTDLSKRIADVKATLDVVQNSEIKTGTILSWRPEKASRVELGGKVNRVRFAPKLVAEVPLLAAACEDHKVYFWRKGGVPRGVQAATHAINDIAFSPKGDALAAASNGSTVRIPRLSSSPTRERPNRHREHRF